MKTIREVIEFLEQKLDEAGIPLSPKHKKQVRYATKPNEKNSLPDGVTAFLNSNLKTVNLSPNKPEWLDEIDKYLDSKSSTASPPVHPAYLNDQFLTVISLIAPLISLEHVFGMKAFHQRFLYASELSSLYGLNLPRNIDEAKRLYDFILKLPTKTIDRQNQSDPPYMAQMLFIVLIMEKAEKNSELWNFQLSCLKNCPKYLLDYVSILKEDDTSLSYRPSFWMACRVPDTVFREILLQRASKQYRQQLKGVIEHEENREKANLTLHSSDTVAPEDLISRVPPSQKALAESLIQFEALLKAEHPDSFKCLKLGASNDEIDKLNKVLAPLRLPEDFITLYKWHNGIEYDGFLFEYPEFLPMADALTTYRDAMVVDEYSQWSGAWFPMGHDSCVYLLIPLSEKVSDSAQVLYYDVECGEIIVHHSSIAAYIKTFIEAYSKGVVFLCEESGRRECDDDALEKLRLKHSPDAYMFEQNETPAFDIFDSSEWPDEWKKFEVK